MITVLGVQNVLAFFEEKMLAGEAAANAAQDVLGNAVLDEARSRVPVLTGNLRDSLTYSDGVVSTDVVYAGQVEYGGIHNPPEPYMRPAADTTSPDEALSTAREIIQGG